MNYLPFVFVLEDASPPLPEVPEHATYILVGAGTASFAAYRAIRKNDNNAKVLQDNTRIQKYPTYCDDYRVFGFSEWLLYN